MKLQSLVTSKRLEEGLRSGDLQHLILNKVSIDQFEPKTGDAKEVLDQYLKARPNLKTREDYKTLFIPNTNLVEKMIEGLIKAGWEPKN